MHFGILGLYVFSGFQFLYNQSNDDAFPLSSIFIIFCHIRVSSKSNGLVMLWKRTWMQSRTSFGLRDGFGKKIESLVFVCGSEASLDLNVNWTWFSSFFFSICGHLQQLLLYTLLMKIIINGLMSKKEIWKKSLGFIYVQSYLGVESQILVNRIHP